jgi:hypothetical protein
VDYLCLGLSQDLGRDVRPMRPRKQTSDARLDAAAKALADAGTLQASVRVPDAIGPLTVQADLRTRQVSTSVAVEAPRDGRPLTRINWILRQLRHAQKDLRLDARFASARETTSLLLDEAREHPQRLLSPSAAQNSPTSSRQATTSRVQISVVRSRTVTSGSLLIASPPLARRRPGSR